MAAVVWTGRHARDPETNAHVFQAEIDSAKVSAYFSEEAVQDHGIPACKTVAEGKILDGMKDGKPPKRVDVTTGDFR